MMVQEEKEEAEEGKVKGEETKVGHVGRPDPQKDS
jgi:hypothetical protein